MKIDLDAIEAVARKAQKFHKETQFQYWSTVVAMGGVVVERFAEDCSPDVVLALVAHVREQARTIARLEMELRDAATEHEADVYEAHKEGVGPARSPRDTLGCAECRGTGMIIDWELRQC